MGMGHLMRCRALAQAWQDGGGDAQFATSEDMRPGSREDALRTIQLAEKADAAWIVVDGYHFGTAYRERLRQTGRPLLFLDDCGDAEYDPADWILNQNLHASESLYAGCDPARLLLGPRYILLRREFLCRAGRGREVQPAGRRILVTFGGSDPQRMTVRAIEALKMLHLPDLEACAVIGPAHGDPDAARIAARDLSFPVRVECSPANLPDLMAWADIAISAAGSTCWELAFLGVPQVVLAVAPNQRPIADALARCGLAESLGEARDVNTSRMAASVETLLMDRKRREEFSKRGRQTVDGMGAARVASRLLEVSAR